MFWELKRYRYCTWFFLFSYLWLCLYIYFTSLFRLALCRFYVVNVFIHHTFTPQTYMYTHTIKTSLLDRENLLMEDNHTDESTVILPAVLIKHSCSCRSPHTYLSLERYRRKGGWRDWSAVQRYSKTATLMV